MSLASTTLQSTKVEIKTTSKGPTTSTASKLPKVCIVTIVSSSMSAQSELRITQTSAQPRQPASTSSQGLVPYLLVPKASTNPPFIISTILLTLGTTKQGLRVMTMVNLSPRVSNVRFMMTTQHTVSRIVTIPEMCLQWTDLVRNAEGLAEEIPISGRKRLVTSNQPKTLSALQFPLGMQLGGETIRYQAMVTPHASTSFLFLRSKLNLCSLVTKAVTLIDVK
jgi:hypothetical protein